MMVRQLTLPFQHVPGYAAEDFIPAANNHEALIWLDRQKEWPCGRLLLWGCEGGGKTHLLRIWSERTGAEWRPGPGLRGWPALEGRAVAVDDADTAQEEPLLHLLNAAAEAQIPVLLAARTPPAIWPVRLPDLASRLRAAATVALRGPDDTLMRHLLDRLLSDRQMQLPPGLAEWLAPRLPRSPAGLGHVVARLDRAAWATGGKLTRPLAAAVLASLDDDEDDALFSTVQPEDRNDFLPSLL